MKFACSAVILVASFQGARAQTKPGFDDIARRAAAALAQDPAEAARLYRQAVGLRPDWAEGWFYVGAGEYQIKRYAESREALRRATELAPGSGASWAFLGLAEYELGERGVALAHILKAETTGLPNDPRFIAEVRVHAALISIRDSEFTTAIDQLRPLAAAGDNSAPVIEAFGIAALTIPVAPEQLPREKKELVNLAGRAIWAFYAQRQEESDALFDQLVKQFPKEPGVHYLRGISFVDRDAATAIAEFEQDLRINPRNAVALVQIAVLHIKGGAPEKGLEPAREAVKQAPGNFLCHLALGRALLALENPKAAIPEFEAAVRIAPAYPHTHFYLGQAYREAGREADARREYEEFTRLKAATNADAK